MESNRLENDPPIQTALDNESPKRGKRRDEANDREVTRRDEKRRGGEEEIKIGKKKGTRESVRGDRVGATRVDQKFPRRRKSFEPRYLVRSKVDRRMNPARVIFIDTRHNLPSRSLRLVPPWIVSYRFVSLRFDNASDFR